MTLNNTGKPLYRHQKVFTASSIWNPFDTPREVDVLLVGGGGGGRSVFMVYGGLLDPGGVGGAGGQVVVIKDYLLFGPVTITVGEGGSPSLNANAPAPGNPTTVVPGGASGISIGAAGGHSGAYDYYTLGHTHPVNYNIYANDVLSNYTPVFGPRVNGARGSSSGGSPSYTRPENGKVFGNRFPVVNYLQTAFTEQGPPETSGYPYGAGGGAGFSPGYNTSYATVETKNYPFLAKGSYGSGSGFGGALDAAPNSGGGGGGSGDYTSPYTALVGSSQGGKGGSGIVVFAWNE